MAKFCANCGTLVNGSTNTGINTNTVNTNDYISVNKIQNMNKHLLKKEKIIF